MGVSENRGTLFGGPYNKDPTMWGTILGSPIFGNPHIMKIIQLLLSGDSTQPKPAKSETAKTPLSNPFLEPLQNPAQVIVVPHKCQPT